jgi:hypothetical protein
MWLQASLPQDAAGDELDQAILPSANSFQEVFRIRRKVRYIIRLYEHVKPKSFTVFVYRYPKQCGFTDPFVAHDHTQGLISRNAFEYVTFEVVLAQTLRIFQLRILLPE